MKFHIRYTNTHTNLETILITWRERRGQETFPLVAGSVRGQASREVRQKAIVTVWYEEWEKIDDDK